MKERNVDLYASLATLGICLLFGSRMRDFGLMGSIFPKYVMIILAVCSAVLLVKSLIKPVKAIIFNHDEPKKILVFVAMLIIWVLLIDKIGFVVSGILVYFLLVEYLDQERKTKPLKSHLFSLGIIVLQVVLFYVLFEIFFGVPLPHGYLL